MVQMEKGRSGIRKYYRIDYHVCFMIDTRLWCKPRSHGGEVKKRKRRTTTIFIIHYLSIFNTWILFLHDDSQIEIPIYLYTLFTVST